MMKTIYCLPSVSTIQIIFLLSYRITCLDVSPEWPEKKAILAGSADGTVKQWSLEKSEQSLKLKSTHSHEIHNHGKEVGLNKFNNSKVFSCSFPRSNPSQDDK